MKVTFWGVRGSLPSPLTPAEIRQQQRLLLRELRQRGLPQESEEEDFWEQLPGPLHSCVGGNTSCVEVTLAGQTLIFDGGSGLRMLGRQLMQGQCRQGFGRLNVFISHTHWDHIQGLPFFAPAFVPGNLITITSGFSDIADRLALQQRPEFFPVPLSALGAEVVYRTLSPANALDLEAEGFPAGSRVLVQELYHPGGAYGYRLECEGKVLVYAADADYASFTSQDLKRHLEFFQNADLLIFDSQFTFREAILKREWGHASALMGVNIAQQAQVKKLALYHHSPDYSDQMLYDILEETRAYQRLHFPEAKMEILLAIEGSAVEL